jgi:GT2 family glycosyltransferase
LINSEFFKKVSGFDPLYWMYLEDVDLSWKSWINGYKVIQNPRAIAYHFTGLYFSYLPNSYYLEDFWSLRNFFYISYVLLGKFRFKKSKKNC